MTVENDKSVSYVYSNTASSLVEYLTLVVILIDSNCTAVVSLSKLFGIPMKSNHFSHLKQQKQFFFFGNSFSDLKKLKFVCINRENYVNFLLFLSKKGAGQWLK